MPAPYPPSPFSGFAARLGARGKPGKRGADHLLLRTQGGARSSLALGYYIIVPTGLQIRPFAHGSLSHGLYELVEGHLLLWRGDVRAQFVRGQRPLVIVCIHVCL